MHIKLFFLSFSMIEMILLCHSVHAAEIRKRLFPGYYHHISSYFELSTEFVLIKEYSMMKKKIKKGKFVR